MTVYEGVLVAVTQNECYITMRFVYDYHSAVINRTSGSFAATLLLACLCDRELTGLLFVPTKRCIQNRQSSFYSRYARTGCPWKMWAT